MDDLDQVPARSGPATCQEMDFGYRAVYIDNNSILPLHLRSGNTGTILFRTAYAAAGHGDFEHSRNQRGSELPDASVDGEKRDDRFL